MADVMAEEAADSAIQAGAGEMADDSGAAAGEAAAAMVEQIEPSVEYDPAHHVQDVAVPASSLTASSNPPDSTFVAALPSTVVERPRSAQQHDTMADPTSAQSPTGRPSSGKLPPLTPAYHSRARLAHDTVGILEDRIADDPKGDVNAWLSLIQEHKSKSRFDDVRKVYDRFFVVFPQAADQWMDYLKFEDDYGTRATKEALLPRALGKADSSMQLWKLYLDHIRRYFPIQIEGNSQTVHRAFQEVVKKVGMDKDAGQIWNDYIAFTKSGPGVIGGNSWVDGQKMDQLRKVYHEAICIPTEQIESIWKEYSAFEMGLNKVTGRKFLQERSPDYMTARGSYVELNNITQNLNRTSIPTFPPAPGFDGDVEFMTQVEIWKKWIQWEKDDPLVLKQSKPTNWKQRMTYVYRQALMALRFWPELWFDAAEFCFDNEMESEGTDFLDEGVTANPESCLLAFRKADRVEQTTTNGNDEDSKHKRGVKVREPYDQLLNELYALLGKWAERETKEIARIDAEFPNEPEQQTNGDSPDDDDDADDEGNPRQGKPESPKASQIRMVKAMSAMQKNLLSRTITHAWIALMRAFQRMQGKGNPKAAQVKGSRGIFTDARRRGRFTSEVWVAAALLEYHTGESDLANKLFDRAMKLFPEDETLSLQYVKWLTSVNDDTNARVTFEKAIQTLSAKPETVEKTKPLYAFFHRYESRYGELAQVVKLEKRMREAFPLDPRLSAFSQRFLNDKDGFDPTAIRPLISPKTQARPKHAIAPIIKEPSPAKDSPPPVNMAQLTNSPKRPFPLDDIDDTLQPQRKIPRGESPLVGAAGRRLENMRRTRQTQDSTPQATAASAYAAPPSLPVRDILFLLSIIPSAAFWPSEMMPIPPEAVVRLLAETNLTAPANQLSQRSNPQFGGPGATYR